MSQIDFENLTTKWPQYSVVWDFLYRWISSHPKVRVVPISRLARAGRNIVTARMLADALDVLVNQGLVVEKYRVQDTDGTLFEQDFDSPQQVPRLIPDRFHQSEVETAERDIVPVYKLEAAGKHGG